MRRSLVVLACLLVALFASPAQVRAAGEQDKSIYGNWPGELHRGNPHADDLARARKLLDAAIHRFWDVYGRDPWNYWAVVDAYYAYADAYHRYVWTLRLYWDWEHSHHRFSGRVLTRDVELFRPDAQIKHIPRPEQPVPSAVVTLTRNLAFLKDQPLARIEEQKQAAQAGTRDGFPNHAESGGARMTIALPEGTWRATSDDRGHFDFVGIPRGSYRYHVKAAGYFPATGLVEIGASKQHRDVFLTRLRRFEGQVFTVTRDIIPILRPLLAKAGQADVASADDVEKILGADQRILPVHRRLIPVEGAKVVLHSNIMYMAQGQRPGQLPPPPPPPGTEADRARPLFHLPEPGTVTGPHGRFSFEDLSETSYRVSVEQPGFMPFNALITLEKPRTFKRIVIFPFVPVEPGKPLPLDAQQSETSGSTLNDPFR